MKTIIYVLAVLSLALTNCKKESISGEGPVETQVRTVSNFDKVFVSGASKTTIRMGDQFSVTVKAYSTLLPYLETRVVNGALQVSYKDDTRIKNDNSEILITMPRLDDIKSEGSGIVLVTGDFGRNDTFGVKISGSSNITIEKGSARLFKAVIEGSGDIKAFGFQSEEADLRVSGSGDTEIAVSKKLDVKISGSGNVFYMGDPASINTEISGSGRLIRQ